MLIETLVVGFLENNCYILADEDSRSAVIIDPGDNEEDILKTVNEKKFKVEKILLTHGHPDHVGAAEAASSETGAPVYIHDEDKKLFKIKAQKPVAENDSITFGKYTIKVLHTPGHTPGSVCFLADGKLFSGDTVFAGSVGRTDLPGGSYRDIMKSIKEKILPLSDDVEILPGHGPSSSIKEEKRENPFLVDAMEGNYHLY
ncbi:MAG: MBL fold metallo-hydrolase [Firmicutes bacterium]|nr:MBL fold metallo-hydrolase [Bacillota bacterium]